MLGVTFTSYAYPSPAFGNYNFRQARRLVFPLYFLPGFCMWLIRIDTYFTGRHWLGIVHFLRVSPACTTGPESIQTATSPSILYPRSFGCWYPVTPENLVKLIRSSIVELNVGVICSCLPSFLGFFRHHLPLLQYITSLIGSKIKFLSFPKPSSRSSSSSSGNSKKRLQTKDIKVTLGSEVDGEGHFLNPRSGFSRDENWSDWERVSKCVSPGPNETRRGHHERGEYGDHSGPSDLSRFYPVNPEIISRDVERGLREQGISGKIEMESSLSSSWRQLFFWYILPTFSLTRSATARGPPDGPLHSEKLWLINSVIDRFIYYSGRAWLYI